MTMNDRAAAAAAASAIGLVGAVLTAAGPEAERLWPQWRGPYATGISVRANPPLEWSETIRAIVIGPRQPPAPWAASCQSTIACITAFSKSRESAPTGS